MSTTKKAKPADRREKKYIRIDPVTWKRFKATATLHGETMEDRIARMIREDIKNNLSAAANA